MKYYLNEENKYSIPGFYFFYGSLRLLLENYNSKNEDLEEEDQGEDERNVIQ